MIGFGCLIASSSCGSHVQLAEPSIILAQTGFPTMPCSRKYVVQFLHVPLCRGSLACVWGCLPWGTFLWSGVEVGFGGVDAACVTSS